MTTDHEAWDIQGLNALDRVSQRTLVWNKFTDVMKILDMEIRSDFEDQLAWLQTNLDQDFVRELLQLHENNNEVLDTIDSILICITVILVILQVTNTTLKNQRRRSNPTKETLVRHIRNT